MASRSVAPATTTTFLVLVLLLAAATDSAEASAAVQSQTGSGDFIRLSCGATRYPALCVQSLSVFAPTIKRSQRQLAQTALTVSLGRARGAAAYVGRLAHSKGVRGRDMAAVRDCVENMGDSMDRLSRSIRELGGAGAGSFEWHMSNVQTWVSAALTDETTCMDGFAGLRGGVRAGVRSRVVNVAQVTSNALALVNRYAQRKRP